MNRRLDIGVRATCAAIVICGLVLALAGSGERPAARLRVMERRGRPGRYAAQFEAMSTDVLMEIAATGPEAAHRLLHAARAEIEGLASVLSAYDPQSDVSRLNTAGSALVAEPTREVIARAVEVSELTGGAFDVTYAPLRELWREAARRGSVPSEHELAEARAMVGYRKLAGDGRSVLLKGRGMRVDLGGIAKGYIIDRAVHALQDAGASSGLVDIGGDLRFFGEPAGRQKWRVQVRMPPGQKGALVLQVPACAVATSGDQARGFRVGDEWYSHIIDPRTGKPVRHAASVTVVAPDAMTADALATALSVLTPQEGMGLVDSLRDVECMILERTPGGPTRRLTSTGFAEFIEH